MALISGPEGTEQIKPGRYYVECSKCSAPGVAKLQPNGIVPPDGWDMLQDGNLRGHVCPECLAEAARKAQQDTAMQASEEVARYQ